MKYYIFKRLLFFIPTLFIISFLTFFLSLNVPGDPATAILSSQMNKSYSGQLNNLTEQHAELRKTMGLDLPLFYFSFHNSCLPDTFNKIPENEKQKLKSLAYKYGNWKALAALDLSLKKTLLSLHLSGSDKIPKKDLSSLRTSCNLEELSSILLNLKSNLLDGDVNSNIEETVRKIDELQENANPLKKYLFHIQFHGSKNQYHRWLFGTKKHSELNAYSSEGVIKGDFGISYKDHRSVASIIKDALFWTLLLGGISFIITFLIAIPLGAYIAAYNGSIKDKLITKTLFFLYSTPNFWLASLLILFFCNEEYLNLFPAYGLGNTSENTFWLHRIMEMAHSLFLPVCCISYSAIAYITMQMRDGIIDVLPLDYIKTANAKGLDKRQVIWKHAFKNALLPVLTSLISMIPMIFTGSFVIEVIFSIPGIGKIAMEALLSKDYPLIYAIVFISALITLSANLLGDVLYTVIDPRINFHKKNNI